MSALASRAISQQRFNNIALRALASRSTRDLYEASKTQSHSCPVPAGASQLSLNREQPTGQVHDAAAELRMDRKSLTHTGGVLRDPPCLLRPVLAYRLHRGQINMVAGTQANNVMPAQLNQNTAWHSKKHLKIYVELDGACMEEQDVI